MINDQSMVPFSACVLQLVDCTKLLEENIHLPQQSPAAVTCTLASEVTDTGQVIPRYGTLSAPAPYQVQPKVSSFKSHHV